MGAWVAQWRHGADGEFNQTIIRPTTLVGDGQTPTPRGRRYPLSLPRIPLTSSGCKRLASRTRDDDGANGRVRIHRHGRLNQLAYLQADQGITRTRQGGGCVAGADRVWMGEGVGASEDELNGESAGLAGRRQGAVADGHGGHRAADAEQRPHNPRGVLHTSVGERALSAFGRLRVMMPTDPLTCIREQRATITCEAAHPRCYGAASGHRAHLLEDGCLAASG